MEDQLKATFPIMLAGKEYELRFDLKAQTAVTTTMKIMGLGTQNINWWRFLDSPYDVGEITVLIMHGINGARRNNGEKKMLTFDDAQELHQKHLDYTYGLAAEIEDEDAAKQFVNDDIQRIFDAIQDAARAGSSFRKSRKTPATV